MEVIKSKDNLKVKHIKSLNDKKYRELYNEFYLEGIKVVDELLDLKNIEIKFIAYSYDILSKLNGGNELIKKLDNYEDILKYNISSTIFNDITDTVKTQGVIAVIGKKNNNIIDILDTDILIIDKVQDAGNLGTIIRTCIAFNIKSIICISGTVDCYSQKVLRSTMAAILKINIIYVNDLEFIKILKENNFKIIGTSLKAKNNIENMKKYEKIALVVGNESNGISDEIINICDDLIKIDMSNEVESLNVAVATSIIIYENFKK